MATQNTLHGQGSDSYLALPDGQEIDCLDHDEFEEQSKAFKKWLERLEPFRYVPSKATLSPYTVRAELRKGKPYWYGYKRVEGHLEKRYVGQSSEVRPYRLEVVADYLNHPDRAPTIKKRANQKPEKLSLTLIHSLARDILADDHVTRHGKDRGAARRALEAMIAHLSDYCQ